MIFYVVLISNGIFNPSRQMKVFFLLSAYVSAANFKDIMNKLANLSILQLILNYVKSLFDLIFKMNQQLFDELIWLCK